MTDIPDSINPEDLKTLLSNPSKMPRVHFSEDCGTELQVAIVMLLACCEGRKPTPAALACAALGLCASAKFALRMSMQENLHNLYNNRKEDSDDAFHTRMMRLHHARNASVDLANVLSLLEDVTDALVQLDRHSITGNISEQFCESLGLSQSEMADFLMKNAKVHIHRTRS